MQRLSGAINFRSRFVREHLRARQGDRVLDIGCGPAELLEDLPEGSYVGIDSNCRYIEAARERHGDRGEFHCVDVREADVGEGEFDLVTAVGVLHHLDDAGAIRLFDVAARALRPDGRLVTIDPAYTPDQGRLARRLIGMDRGACVRTLDGYTELGEQCFEHVSGVVREDLLRTPWTHGILECEGPRRG